MCGYWSEAPFIWGMRVKRARDNGIALNVLSTKPPRHQSLFKAMRFHQWVKNILIFAVPGLNILHFKPEWIITLLAGFVAFGLVASATYILNDLLDIQDDRKHPTKKHRVFARGALDIKTGLIGMFALAATGMAIGLMIGPMFALTILGYGLISTSYSLVFKKIAILDTIVLSFLFCWRVLAGAVIITVPVAPWFFAAIAFFFFSLALGKRCIELRRNETRTPAAPSNAVSEGRLAGRGYRIVDKPVVLALGIAGGVCSTIIVLIYALLSRSSIIDHDVSAFLVGFLLMGWTGQFWLLVNRGEVHDDPIVFALKDKASLAVLSVIGLTMLVEQLI